jgi:adenylate cyclase class 2
MKIEYEATFPNIDKDEIREKLKNVGATLVRPEFLQKRIPFFLPTGNEIPGGFLRVRDEGDKITMTLKVVNGENIEDQKEIILTVNNFDEAVNFLKSIGCTEKSYQETKREIWELDGVEIMIDEWPFLEPFVEIEGQSEDAVRNVSEKLGFDYDSALFCTADKIYAKKYNMSAKTINNLLGREIPKLTFKMKNPFIK